MGVHKDGVGLLELAGYLGTILYYASLLLGFERYGMMAVLLGLVLLMFVYVFTYPKYEADQVMSAFLESFMWQSCFPLFSLREILREVNSLYG